MMENSFVQDVRKYICDELSVKFRPDGYHFFHDKRLLIVNVKNVSDEKLNRIAIFYVDCDYYEWDVQLYHRGIEIPLLDIYYDYLSKMNPYTEIMKKSLTGK